MAELYEKKVGSWLLAMVRSGKMEDLAALDAAKCGKLGTTTVAQIRCLRAILAHEKGQGIFADDWSEAHVLRDAVVCFVDLSSAFAGSEIASDALPGLEKARASILNKCKLKLKEVTDNLAKTKSSLQSLIQDSDKVTRGVFAADAPELLSEECQAIINKHNGEESKELKQAVPGKGCSQTFVCNRFSCLSVCVHLHLLTLKAFCLRP